jgi:hypothetical protein
MYALALSVASGQVIEWVVIAKSELSLQLSVPFPMDVARTWCHYDVIWELD